MTLCTKRSEGGPVGGLGEGGGVGGRGGDGSGGGGDGVGGGGDGLGEGGGAGGERSSVQVDVSTQEAVPPQRAVVTSLIKGASGCGL